PNTQRGDGPATGGASGENTEEHDRKERSLKKGNQHLRKNENTRKHRGQGSERKADDNTRRRRPASEPKHRSLRKRLRVEMLDNVTREHGGNRIEGGIHRGLKRGDDRDE